MKLILGPSLSRMNDADALKLGRMVRIEFFASTGDGFAERTADFLTKLSALTSQGSSRSIGIIDGDKDERKIQLFIDGDGADFIRDVKISTK